LIKYSTNHDLKMLKNDLGLINSKLK